MLSRNDHDGLVMRLYASALGDTPWVDTLAHFANQFHSSAAAIQVSDPLYKNITAESHGYSKEFAAEFYASDVYERDPRIKYYRSVRPGDIYFDHCLYDVAEMERDPRCRESIDILKVKYQLGAALSLPNDVTAFLVVLSTASEGHASEAAISAFRRLVPHIDQACALGHLMEQKSTTQTVLLDALASKADGVILLDRTGAPTFVNDPARQMLAAGDGLAFRDGAFVTRRGPETRCLQRLVLDAIAASDGAGDRPGGETLVTRPSGLHPYVLRVMPAPPTERFLAGQSIACVVHLRDLAAIRLPSAASLSAVFGLTEREVDLAIELVRSTSLQSAAGNAGMAVNTARNHLQNIFRKCNASSQAEAVQLFSRLP